MDKTIRNDHLPVIALVILLYLPAASAKTDEASDSAPGASSWELGTISPDAVIQSRKQINRKTGKIVPKSAKQSPDVVGGGECYFAGALASESMSERGKQQIRRMIKPNPDGSYTVTFPGAYEQPVTVTGDDLNLAGRVQNQGARWASIIETAFLKYDKAGPYLTDADAKPDKRLADTPKNAPARHPDDVLRLLAGKPAIYLSPVPLPNNNTSKATSCSNEQNIHASSAGSKNDDQNVTTDELQLRLQKAFNAGWPVTAGSGTNGPPISRLASHGPAYPLITGHCYSVVAYNPQTHMVTVRDPHGYRSRCEPKENETINGVTGGKKGYFTMPFDTFYRLFNGIEMVEPGG